MSQRGLSYLVIFLLVSTLCLTGLVFVPPLISAEKIGKDAANSSDDSRVRVESRGASEQSVNSVASEYSPMIAAASNEGETAIKSFKIPEGMNCKLIASEPLLANPVCFCLDERGRIFVAETFRQQKGVEDNRSHMHWLEDDLAARTVEDRLAYFKKHLGAKIQEYAREHDRIRLLEDVDGDGSFEKSTVFADGFNGILQGTGAGLLARRGNIYYTCIPDVFLLRDEDGDGRADVKKSLHYGYGVRVAFRGHDSHGLVQGPDGRIYFSIGDRGYNIKTPDGRVLEHPECGAVFRCEPDGSQLEEVATGLRNPQELSFDLYGNLFTCDNNSDSGDRARWTYLPEGADIGWRMYYQYLSDRGPWNREKLWHPAHAGQPAYIVPCILNFADGPSGLTHYPGLGLSERYRDHFFLADFRGGAGNSGIRSFAMQRKGASFEMVDAHEFIWRILATDVDFALDGGLVVSDWVDGWNGLGKGRLYRFEDPQAVKDPRIGDVKRMFRDGFAGRAVPDLVALLAHPDYRVRLESQLTLAEQGAVVAPVLLETIKKSTSQLARIHALWALGQLGRKQPDLLKSVVDVLQDADAEVRTQASKVLGEAIVPGALHALILGLKDTEAPVRMQCAISIGHYHDTTAIQPLLQLLEENKDQDATLRHAVVMGLTGACQGNDQSLTALLAATDASSVAVRLGILLTLRRLKHRSIERFLTDVDPLVVDEAARAIHDVPIVEGQIALANLATRSHLNDETWRRVISSNFRLGTVKNAEVVATIAARSDLSDMIRIEALNALADWAQPSGRDRVLGDWRPLAHRDEQIASSALKSSLGGVFSGTEKVRQSGAQVAAKLGVKEVGPVLNSLLNDQKNPVKVRVEALKGLQSLQDVTLKSATLAALTDPAPEVRAAAHNSLATFDADQAIHILQAVLQKGDPVEQQSAFQTLAELNSPDADSVLLQQLKLLQNGGFPPSLALDLLEAAGKRKVQILQDAIQQFESNRPKDVPLSAYSEVLWGGDAERGRSIFYERSQVSCVRCHRVGGQGGEVGPDLTKIGMEKQRGYLLEAIIEPNKQIAKGFETVVVITTEGLTHAGIVKSENSEKLQLLTPEGKTITVSKAEIDERASGKSSMPEDMTKYLNKRDLRDLIEFLATRANSPMGGANQVAP